MDKLTPTISAAELSSLPEGLQAAYLQAADGSFTLALAPRGTAPSEAVRAATLREQIGEAAKPAVVQAALKKAGLTEDQLAEILPCVKVTAKPDGTFGTTVRDPGTGYEKFSLELGKTYMDLTEFLRLRKQDLDYAAKQQEAQRPAAPAPVPVHPDSIVETRRIDGVECRKLASGDWMIGGLRLSAMPPIEKLKWSHRLTPTIPGPRRPARATFTEEERGTLSRMSPTNRLREIYRRQAQQDPRPAA